MKRTIVLALALFLFPALSVLADHDAKGKPSDGARSSGGFGAAHAARRPVVINMSRPSSGGHNRNYPSPQNHPAASFQPSYGRIQWNAPKNNSRPDMKAYAAPGLRASLSAHHHPYSQGYVRKKLQKIGVKNEPSFITERSEIIHTDRMHSTIGFPQRGPDHNPLTATAFSPRRFNDPVVRDHMALVDGPEWHSRIDGFNRTESERGRYYWHSGDNFNYCHYIDGSGYHWWGWYQGDHFFWTRSFSGRWWWYDPDFDRWCFWNEGFWWWQDPYHVGDLYCYNNDNYIPCNSAEDQVVVQSSDSSDFQNNTSPDGTRVVKVATDTQDAFLYDTANPPSFQPIYLASGVQSVQFSDPSNGRPLEIILKLNDGSFDMFDGQGNPYNSGASEEDQAAPTDGGTPPSDSNAPPAAPGASGT